MSDKRAYLDELKRTLAERLGCVLDHVRTVPVSEVFKGREIWRGDVEVYDITGHAKARRVYAWGYPGEREGERMEVVAVLEIPPVTSPESAVKVAIASMPQG